MATGMLICQYFSRIFGLGGNMQTTIDRFGKIVLPKRIRDDFNLAPGCQIHSEESGQEIILKPIHGEPGLRLKEGGSGLHGSSFRRFRQSDCKTS